MISKTYLLFTSHHQIINHMISFSISFSISHDIIISPFFTFPLEAFMTIKRTWSFQNKRHAEAQPQDLYK